MTIHILFRFFFPPFPGRAHPGLILSNRFRARVIFSMIFSTVAVQTNGRGASFQASKNATMAWCNSSTLIKAPRRTAFWVSSPNHRSTWIQPAGTGRNEMEHESGIGAAPSLHLGVFSAVIIDHQVQIHFLIRELVLQTAQKL